MSTFNNKTQEYQRQKNQLSAGLLFSICGNKIKLLSVG